MEDDVTGAPDPNAAAPLSPATADELRAMSGAIMGAMSDVDALIQAALSPASADVLRAYSDVNANINETVGAIDLSLAPQELAVTRAISRTVGAIEADLLSGEAEAGAAGVYMPVDTPQMWRDLQDDTGDSMIARIMGVDPVTQAAGAELPALDVPPEMPQDMPGFDPYTGTFTGFDPNAPPAPLAPPVSPPPPAPCACPDPAAPLAEPLPPPLAPPPPPSCSEWDTVVAVRPTGWSFCGVGTLHGKEYQTLTRDGSRPDPFERRPDINVLLLVPDEPPPAPPPAAPPPPPEPASVLAAALAGLPSVIDPPRVVEQPGFESRNVCAVLDQWEAIYGRLFTKVGPGSDRQNSSVSDILRVSTATATTIIDDLFRGRPNDQRAAAVAQNYLLTGDFIGGYSQAFAVHQMLGESITKKPDAAWSIGVVLGAAHKGESSSGVPLDYLTTSLQYLYKSINPQYIPDQSELDDLLLQGFIGENEWACWTRCHGNIPERRRDVLAAKRPVPTPDQIVQLEQRGGAVALLANEYWDRSKVGREADRQAFRELAKFVPGPADLVRFMVRDAFDAQVVKAGNLDKDFDAKFYGPGGKGDPGRAAEWARAQGMTEDQFRYFWYSHWDYPSNTALYLMLHRLRPDRPEVIKWDESFGAGQQLGGGQVVPPRPLVMTIEDVRRIVEINDMAPAMVDPLLAISYHPITRTDAIDAFLSGAFTADDLYHVFRDNGYDEPTARVMVRIQETKAARRNNNLTGVWSIRKTVVAYRDGVIDGETADRLLTPLLPNADTRQQALASADLESEADVQRAKLKNLKRGYVFGAMDDGALNEALVGIGVSPLKARQLREQWHSDKTGKYREPSAKQVLGWLKYGVINTGDAQARLRLIGFADWDIARMINQAILEWAERTEGKIDKAQKKKEGIDKTLKDERRETEQQLRARQADAEKRVTELTAVLDRVRNELRDRGLTSE